ncbi:quinone oxidoreductase [Aquabacterium sp. J223]|nr:quinone oxidoreductase [Aquabacterium sp. J223]UUX97887.1 quinone oxidoreductase [Aquabacterium sp. J223]
MQWLATDPGEPGPGQVRLRQVAVGCNFIDIYQRRGSMPLPLPSGLGMEAAGVVQAVGEGVRHVAVGDRVAYVDKVTGAYADERVVSAEPLVRLPDGVGFEQAASMMTRGLTAQLLLRRAYAVQPGDAVLVHAAAGGVGQIACQWAKALGALVIGTVGSAAKAEVARAHGCDLALVQGRDDVVAQVRAATAGAGVAVVYDSIGRDTLMQSLDCLRPRGLMVAFGATSGPLPALDTMALLKRGSLFFTRLTLAHYTAQRPELEAAVAELFAVVASGAVKVGPSQVFALAEAAKAHAAMEARQTTGATVLRV